MNNSHKVVAKLAYELYLRDGCPQGKEHEHWEEAETILATERMPTDEDIRREEGEGGLIDGYAGELRPALAQR
jgi:hypothetical protein